MAETMDYTQGLSPDAVKRYQAIQKIVNECQAAKVEGHTIDLFTASHVLKVAQSINLINRERFLTLNVKLMVGFTWKVLK